MPSPNNNGTPSNTAGLYCHLEFVTAMEKMLLRVMLALVSTTRIFVSTQMSIDAHSSFKRIF